MDAKKNTILLTVIAVATLLVAVVGASFAFFAIQTNTENADIQVETTTAKTNDSFVATGSGDLTLNVTNDIMVKEGENYGQVAVSDTAGMTVSLTSGSTAGAKCTYHILYNGSTNYTMTEGAADGLEYTISGSNGTDTIAETNVKNGLDLGEFTIEVPAGDDAAGKTVTKDWTFTANFYNLEIDQATQMNKTFTGVLTADQVDCTLAE